MKFSTKQKIAAAAGIATSGVLASSLAFAAWSGSNAAAPAAGKARDIAFTVASATATADVYPGADGALTFTVTNSRPFAITVNTLDASSATFGVATNCDASFVGHSITVTAAMGAGGSNTVAGNGSKTFTVPAAYTWTSGTGSNNACQSTDVSVTNATVSASAF
jgi:hypothetical protein